MTRRPKISELRKQIKDATDKTAALEAERMEILGLVQAKDAEIKRLIKEREEMRIAAQNNMTKYDGVKRQLEHLMRMKDGWDLEAKIARRDRDENGQLYAQARDRIFELEAGIAPEIAKAKGELLFYKQKLAQLMSHFNAFAEHIRSGV